MTSSGAPSRSVAPDRPGGVDPSTPPLRPWVPLVWVAALAAVLSVVVVALVPPPGALDDPDPASQRDGLLLDGPRVADAAQGVRFGQRPVVLLFVRELPEQDALIAWATEVPERAEVVLVLPADLPGGAVLPTVVDPAGRLAEMVGMPRPVGGGPPVGYAVVDSDRVVRYATLDPEYLQNAFEIGTITGSVR